LGTGLELKMNCPLHAGGGKDQKEIQKKAPRGVFPNKKNSNAKGPGWRGPMY